MPYQPYSKDTRIGKIADWTGSVYPDKRYQNKYASQFGAGSQYSYYHDEDESTFQLVDTAKVQKTQYQRSRMRYNQQRLRRERQKSQAAQPQMQILSRSQKQQVRARQQQMRKWQKQFGRQHNDYNRGRPSRTNRESSVAVSEQWAVVEEMDFLRLNKLAVPRVEPPTDLYVCGEMEYYDKSYDRVTTRNERRLQRINRVIHTVTTTQDPIIRKLAKDSVGNVYATDAILATLMCCTRSNYSWDIVVQRVGDKLFLDKRDDSDFDLLTVYETAVEQPSEDPTNMNSAKNLALEATFINHNFSQQVLRKEEAKFSFEDNANPFAPDEDDDEEELELASVGYRYRKWTLGEGIELVVRCEHDAVTSGGGGSGTSSAAAGAGSAAAAAGGADEKQFMSIKALNEWDPRAPGAVDWRSKLDSQRGAVLAAELKNNAFKLAKWTVCALLAGSDQIKFGYVSRINPKDSSKHVILGTQQFKPIEFASQINLLMENAWGILKCVINILQGKPEGKYLIMKDPNKPMVRIYDIPNNSFESDVDDSDEDSDEDNNEDDDEDEDADNEGEK